MGKPLTRPQTLIEMVDYSKRVGIKEVCLNTNAILLTQNISKHLISVGLDKLLISIDGYRPSTYERIRKGGNYETLLENIDLLLQENKNISSTLEIIVQFIITEENEKEVEDFKNFWLRKGVTVKIRPKLSWGKAIESPNQSLEQKDRTYPCP
jgi:MoaA/NifB/PqqE/SkfB family radical SAM enzyme